MSEWCWHGWLMCVNKHHSYNSVLCGIPGIILLAPSPLQLYSPLSKHLALYTCPAAHINARHLVLHWQVSLFFGLLELSETCGMTSFESPLDLHMLQPGPGDVRNATFVQNEDRVSLMQDMTDAFECIKLVFAGNMCRLRLKINLWVNI